MEHKSVEELAIQANKKGWGQLFLRDENETFIGKRPYPSNFWHDVDKWIAGYQAGQASKALPLNQELIEALKRISDQIFNLRVKHPSIEAELYPVEMDVYNLMDRIAKASLQKAEGLVSQPSDSKQSNH